MDGKPGLREKKKQRTRALIEGCALHLFVAQGFIETTLDQIADAAEVSNRTVNRYFATKEQLVVGGMVDPVLKDAIRNAPRELGDLAAIRAGMRNLYRNPPELQRSRFALIIKTPGLRNGLIEVVEGYVNLVGAAIAARSGRPARDVHVRTIASAAGGVMLSALADAIDCGETDLETCLRNIDLGLAQLEAWIDD
ncbi:TetR family transcriptional regulator [Nocardia sp. ET3-3]|uniref:TetR family transcriptional regulator n=1 Tax=Nocardia terrae TaxID=2675851 RepID=A0A7K1V272_9NOCA|nr:TetR family transcriptional regulator [Nocardia terrae]MVU80740.1 TetR family transcriptional regulator [Nocardia terrae]